MIEKAREIGDMVIKRIGWLSEIRQTMATLIIGENAEISGKFRKLVIPDAAIGAERVGKHQKRLVSPRKRKIVMDDDAVNRRELHAKLLPVTVMALDFG